MTTKVREKNLTAGFFMIEACLWGQYAVLLGYSSMYLLDHSFSNAAIGIMLAVAGLVSALLQPTVAAYADRPDSVSLKKLLIILCSAILVLSCGLLIGSGQPLLLGILLGTGIAVLQLITPLVNALGVESINQGKRLNFGFARGGGSAAYAVCSYLVGVLAERTGTVIVPIGILILFGGLLLSLMLFPFEKDAASTGAKQAETKQAETKQAETAKHAAASGSGEGSKGAFLARYPRFSLVLIGCVLLYISHTVINNFAFQVVSSKGGGSAQTGTGMAIAAVLEMLPMFLFGYMLKKVRCDIWFRISGIFFALKVIATYLAPTIPVYYGVQVLQIFGWGLMTVSSVIYVNQIMKPQDAVKGQAYMTMTFTLGNVIGSAAGGRLMDVSGVNAMLLFGSAVGVIGMLIVLFAAEKGKGIVNPV